MKISVGTKSVLFGTHAFWWHPIVVARAWRHLYGVWPTVDEWVAIVCHDLGYFGCSDMDGPSGLLHPVPGARIARGVVFFLHRDRDRADQIFYLCVGHSSGFAKLAGIPISPLCGPDKCSLLFEPWWFYRLRSTLSGELKEYVANGPFGLTPREWFEWISRKFRARYENKSAQCPVDQGASVDRAIAMVDSRPG